VERRAPQFAAHESARAIREGWRAPLPRPRLIAMAALKVDP